jgi:Zn-finger nucleic acid-binding protein
VLCPFDATTLQVVNRSGVEIDWCPSCKGVWLERGELDKLIDQADGAGSMPPPPRAPMPAPVAPAPSPYPDQRGGDARYTDPRYAERRRDWDDDDDDDRRRSDGDGSRDGDGYRPKKRKNLLSEIFDF